MNFEELKGFYGGKKVFITGHTGFKGAWLCKILNMAGADVFGYGLEPPTIPNAFTLLNINSFVHSTIGDIRDFDKLKSTIVAACPEYVFHLAAQPIVRESYRIPRETFETNVMGTVNMLECLRILPGIKSFINVTTDKVYENNDRINCAFTEEDRLDGYDPYSNSKSCSELVTHSYIRAFFCDEQSPVVSTARAGNVIGGGDFALDRVIPDCVRAAMKGERIKIRNPYSIRPYQHVLEPISIYLTIVMRQTQDRRFAGSYNVGPDDEDCVTTGELADLFVKYWGDHANWHNVSAVNAPHEASFLQLDCSKLKSLFTWRPVWHIEKAMNATVEWYKTWAENGNIRETTERQIGEFFGQ